MYDIDRLKRKWQQYQIDNSIDSSVERICESRSLISDRVFELLVDAYTRPDRYYHNLNHIECVLDTIERFSDLQNPIAVYLAAWFHDFVYDPQASDNEAQSAKAAQALLTNLGESAETIDRVQQLILATQGHQIAPTVGGASPLENRDLSIFLDADLAILGADPVRYQAYQRSIRREYNWVSDPDYQTGRTQVLESFLARDRLYYTDLLFNELESIARLNLEQEIASLRNLT
jgi:predicted metal-dependent HD superfamily phosphohydrolase